MTSPYHVKGITSLSELDMKTISEYPTKVWMVSGDVARSLTIFMFFFLSE
jgi:hypothetical protein